MTNAPSSATPSSAADPGLVWPPRALGAVSAAAVTVWLTLTALAPAPVPPAVAGLLAGAAVLLLPRLGWWALTVALTALAVAQHLPGAAGMIAIALLLGVVLVPLAPTTWPLSAGAPALGLIGLAGAWPALAARAGTLWRRAALGAVGWVWLLLASAIAGKPLYLPLVSGVAAPQAWMSSLSVTVDHLLRPEISAGALVPALVWALAAVTLPWLVRGESLALDVVRVVVWAAALVSATGAAVAAWHGTGGVGAAPTALLGALACGRRRAGPVAARDVARGVALRWPWGETSVAWIRPEGRPDECAQKHREQDRRPRRRHLQPCLSLGGPPGRDRPQTGP